MQPDFGFQHRYVPAQRTRDDGRAPWTLLLLHGTGGDERDLLPLGAALDPTANLLSPRGKVLEHGMARYFRRFAEGVLDEADVAFRANEVATFVTVAAQHYAFDLTRVIAVGYSNGANLAVGMVILHSTLFARAVLFRAVLSLTQQPLPDLTGFPIFLSEGEHDPILTPGQSQLLADTLRRAGANVTLRWWPTAHGLTEPEIPAARAWLATEYT